MSADPPRLSETSLVHARKELIRPEYDRARTGIGVVHFGPGAFHRAHQAYYFDRLLERDPSRAISAVSLKTSHVRDALAPQDELYTLVELDKRSTFRVIGSIKELLVAAEAPARVFARLASPDISLVTITVTEKGYCLDGRGHLDFAHPDISHDLESPETPRSLAGWLAHALDDRRKNGLDPFVSLSCDNLEDNGTKLGRSVTEFARAKDAELAAWIEDDALFPNTMVDTIVPATDDALKTLVALETGLSDAWPVQRESFVQWVIEKYESSNSPDWESIGVTISGDVPAYSRAKLRMLNGAHSTLAYLGLLASFGTVAEAISDPALGAFVEHLLNDDLRFGLHAPDGLDLSVYARAIVARFRNPALHHRLSQIASDGSKKLPERIVAAALEAATAGRPLIRLALPISAWMAFVANNARAGIPIVDPLSAELARLGQAATGNAAIDVPRFLSLDSMFPSRLARDREFTRALARAYEILITQGSLAAARWALGGVE